MNPQAGRLDLWPREAILQAIIDAIDDGRLDAEIAVEISNTLQAQGSSSASRQAVSTPIVLIHKDFPSREAFDGPQLSPS